MTLLALLKQPQVHRIGHRPGSLLAYSFSVGRVQFTHLTLDVIQLYDELLRPLADGALVVDPQLL